MSAALKKQVRESVRRELAVAMKYPENNVETNPDNPTYQVVFVTPRFNMSKLQCTEEVYFQVCGTPAEENAGQPPDAYSYKDANFAIVKGTVDGREIVVGVDVLPNMTAEKGTFAAPTEPGKNFVIELSVDQVTGSFNVKHVPAKFAPERLLRILARLDAMEEITPGTVLEPGCTISSVVGTDIVLKLTKAK